MNNSIKNNLFKGLEDDSIKERYQMLYSIKDDSFYKHIDELVIGNKRIKATLGPVDLTVVPFDGVTLNVVKENRIDLLSTAHYGKASLWRAIAYINNISDPLNLTEGVPILIPNITGLRRFPNPLS